MPVSSDVIPFQSTLPREERHLLPVFCRPEYLYFNPRSHERSDEIICICLCCIFYFNPRSHERSDRVQYLTSQAHQFISIHAPTRGATELELYKNLVFTISIHAPTRGATLVAKVALNKCGYFNPRSHERSD